MLLRVYIPALCLVHGALALSHESDDSRLDNHVLRSGRQYTSEIEVLAVSGQANNNLAMIIGQNNNNNTSNRANSNAMNDTAEFDPLTRRLADVEARGFKSSTYLSWEDPEGCPPPLPECTDCGGRMISWHRDMVDPSTRCAGVSPSFRLNDSD